MKLQSTTISTVMSVVATLIALVPRFARVFPVRLIMLGGTTRERIGR